MNAYCSFGLFLKSCFLYASLSVGDEGSNVCVTNTVSWCDVTGPPEIVFTHMCLFRVVLEIMFSACRFVCGFVCLGS